MKDLIAQLRRIGARHSFVMEVLIFLGFCALTSLLTWPYVTRLRDAVVDPGDPYLVSWILWWDYHQTFADPLNLFHSNVFYPYRYTLAFSENCYGIALLFFPLFLLGCRPLTVHAVAMFFGFAACGYGAFRLARTLTGSYAAAWVAGIIFAFGPFRFHYMSHLPYLFAAWIPLLLEALVLFVRDSSVKRAVWLGVAFFMTGLATLSWLILSVAPFAICAAVLLTRHGLWRSARLWRRGAIAVGAAGLALMPFMMPYYLVSRLYGFRRSIDEVKANSASPIHWLSVERRNKLWSGLGAGINDGWRFKLFPGLLPILLSLVALVQNASSGTKITALEEHPRRNTWIRRLDILALVFFVLSVPAIGFDRTDYCYSVFKYFTSEIALTLLLVTIVLRLCLAYPTRLCRGDNINLIQTIRSERRSDTFWIGTILFLVGFCYSLGWNSFVYRILYDIFLPFRSMRVPTRGAMIAYLGLSLLAGLGCLRLGQILTETKIGLPRPVCYVLICGLLLFEFNGAPLDFIRGDVFPDAVTTRLKETPMRGGIVVLPASAEFNHHHILRAADHGKPLIVGTSGFNPPYEDQIENLTRSGPISDQFIELMEQIPASYVVIENNKIASERRDDYDSMLKRALATGRFRFINRFDEHNDLYAVTRTEPQAQAEAATPFSQTVTP